MRTFLDREDEICGAFVHGGLSYLSAVENLADIGYDPEEAKRIVNEWADSMEPDGVFRSGHQ